MAASEASPADRERKREGERKPQPWLPELSTRPDKFCGVFRSDFSMGKDGRRRRGRSVTEWETLSNDGSLEARIQNTSARQQDERSRWGWSAQCPPVTLAAFLKQSGSGAAVEAAENRHIIRGRGCGSCPCTPFAGPWLWRFSALCRVRVAAKGKLRPRWWQ